MSFKSRERKRRARVAIANSSSKHREAMKERHYLTIVSRACCCNRCARSLREGHECVYRHTPREILCLDCATEEGIYYLSRRWERKNGKRKNGRLVPAARRA